MYRLNRRVLLSLCLLLASGYAASVEHEKQAAQGTNADQSLTTRVEDALRADPALKAANNVSVEASEGEVTLSGSVENTAQAERVVQVVRKVTGVKYVKDKMIRETTTGMPASPHQSTTVDAPLKGKEESKGSVR